MNQYELCVLFSGNAATTEIDALAKQVEGLLASAQAEIKFAYGLGRRKLAYKIIGNAHGEYRIWLFLAQPEAITQLNEKLRLSQSVIRHVMTKLERVSIEDKIKHMREPKKEIFRKPKEAEELAQRETEEKKAGLDQLDKKLDELLKSNKI